MNSRDDKEQKSKIVSKFQQKQARTPDDIDGLTKTVSGKGLSPKLSKDEKLKRAQQRKQARSKARKQEKERGEDGRER